jgi:hypothetical protein
VKTLPVALAAVPGTLLGVATAHAMCDVIPQSVTSYPAAEGSASAPYASPGDVLSISLDAGADGCEAGASFGAPITVASSFEGGDSGGWSAELPGTTLTPESTGGSPGGWLRVTDGTGPASILAPAAFLGDWQARGVTELSWDHFVDSAGASSPSSLALVRIDGATGGYAEYSFDPSTVPDQTWTHLAVPVDPATAPPGWVVGWGSWQSILHDVTSVRIDTELRSFLVNEDYGVDNLTLSGASTPLGGVATLVVAPPGATASAVVVAPFEGACATEPLATELTACQAELGGGPVECVGAAAVATATRFSFPFPDSGRAGPARIAISPYGAPLPCELATTPCADLAAGAATACVGELYEGDGVCPAEGARPGRLFSYFTALPAPNPFHEMCTSNDPNTPCLGTMPDGHATLDDRGNLLLPFNWAEALLPGRFPTPRLVRVRSDFEAFPGGGAPIDPPGPAFYDSFSLGGRLLPPFFEEFEDPASGEPSFVGSIDAARGVVRLLRRSPTFRECRNDATGQTLTPGVPCTSHGDCPSASSCKRAACYAGGVATTRQCAEDAQCQAGEECGPSLFDFASRAAAGGGVLTIASSQYQAEAQNPVPFDGLLRSDQAILSVRSEPLENDGLGAELNGDGDADDVAVVSLRRPDKGTTLELGGAGVVGPATTRVEQLPLEFPAIALEGDRAAFLLKVADQLPNPGVDVFDTELAVKRIDLTQSVGFVDETPALPPQADPAPLVNGKPLVISNGRVFFRESEPRTAGRANSHMDQTATGSWPDAEVHSHSGGSFINGDIEISADGRHVVFATAASEVGGLSNPTGLERVYVLDRDPDGNGVYDEPGSISFSRQPSIACQVYTATFPMKSTRPDITADGRYVVYESNCPDLGTSTWLTRWDRDPDENGIYDEQFPGTWSSVTISTYASAAAPSISDDGRLIAFQWLEDFAAIDTNGFADVYIRDMDAPCCPASSYTLAMNDLLGQVGNGPSVWPKLSGDGKHLVFMSTATNLESVPVTDTNGTYDVFARGPNSLLIKQISQVRDRSGNRVAPNGPSKYPSISRDGRVVVFSSAASDLPGGDRLGQIAYVVDRDVDADGVYDELGQNQVLPLPMNLGSIDNYDARAKVSPDGRWVSVSGVIPPGGGLPGYGVFDRLTRTFSHGYFGNGPIALSVALPTAISEDGRDVVQLQFACNPLECVSTGLRLHGFIGSIDRSDPAADVSGDGDPLDTVLSVYDPSSGQVTTVAAAERVAVAGDRAAFLLPEAAVNGAGRCAALGGVPVAGGCDLSGDADADDRVVHLYDAAANTLQNLGLPARDVLLNDSLFVALAETGGDPQAQAHPAGSGGSWVVLDDAVYAQLRGDKVALLVPTPGSDDHTARLFQLAPGSATPVALVDGGGAPQPDPPARDLVLGDQILALRSPEAEAGELNGDGDTADAVMRVVVLATGRLFETGQAAVPCPIEACDPNEPYRVKGQQVVFITMEADQGADLDGDGRSDGFIVQFYNAAAAIAANDDAAGGATLAATTTGVCTDTGEACFDITNCASGVCLVPPGVCAGPTATPCDPENTGDGACSADQFCDPPSGVCFQYGASCELDADCSAGEACLPANQEIRTLDNPLDEEPEGGQRQLARGLCSGMAETCVTDEDCAVGTCEPVLVYAASGDEDGDGVVDAVDVCTGVADEDQLDTDDDGLGDACDRQTCGNGIQEYQEGCDHGVQNGQDGLCDAGCAYVGAAAACANGVDDDGDGLVDLADPGCADASDTSERRPDVACDDGIDNDGDYGVDRFGDPGCAGAGSNKENPQCSNGIDDDNDGKIDFDGGGLGPADPHCTGPSDNRELPNNIKHCGLGFELAFLVPLLRLLLLRRRRARG